MPDAQQAAGPAPSREMDAAGRALRRVLIVILVIIALFFLWQLVVVGLGIPAYLVPRPMAVLDALVKNWTVIGRQTAFTMGAAALGLIAATTLAVVIAISFSLSRNVAQASLPVVIAFRSAPVPAVAPIIMLFLGRGLPTSMMVVTIVSFFPLMVNLMRGLASADRNAGELLHVYGASAWQQLRYVRIPFALPFLFTGLRVGAANAILGAMLSEWITGSRGLGNLILESGEMRETEILWASILMSVAVAMVVFWITSAGERRVLHWRT